MKKMTTRKVGAALGAVAAAAGVGVAAPATVSAAPVPHYAPIGDHLLLPPTLDGHCYGTLFVDLQTTSNPDVVDVRFVPTGTYGAAPGCDVHTRLGVVSGINFGGGRDAIVSGGPTTVPLHVGRGLSAVTVAATQPFGVGGGGYLWLAP